MTDNDMRYWELVNALELLRTFLYSDHNLINYLHDCGRITKFARDYLLAVPMSTVDDIALTVRMLIDRQMAGLEP